MYDVKSEAHEFVGARRQEAIEKACQFYGVDESALVISEFGPGVVYGLAARTAIVAVPRDRAKSAPQRSRGEGARRDEEPRGNSGRESGRDSGRESGRGRDRGRDRGASASSREGREPRGNREEREPRRNREEPEARGDREAREPRGNREDREPSGNREKPEARGDREEREPRGDRGRAPRRDAEPAARTAGSSAGSAIGELGEIGQFLLGTIERMGLGAFEVDESTEGELIVLHVKGVAAEALSAGQGRTVDALQLLVNQVSARVSTDRQRVVIDVEGDADAREDFLSKLADRVAKRALQTGRPVALDPMNGRDRRMIHMALRDRQDVATMSEGEGRYRQVVVVPENSDEFDHARSQAERHQSD